MDQRRGQSLPAQLPIGWLKVSGQRVDLVPQRLGPHHQAFSLHDPALALQRQMIEVL